MVCIFYTILKKRWENTMSICSFLSPSPAPYISRAFSFTVSHLTMEQPSIHTDVDQHLHQKFSLHTGISSSRPAQPDWQDFMMTYFPEIWTMTDHPVGNINPLVPLIQFSSHHDPIIASSARDFEPPEYIGGHLHPNLEVLPFYGSPLQTTPFSSGLVPQSIHNASGITEFDLEGLQATGRNCIAPCLFGLSSPGDLPQLHLPIALSSNTSPFFNMLSSGSNSLFDVLSSSTISPLNISSSSGTLRFHTPVALPLDNSNLFFFDEPPSSTHFHFGVLPSNNSSSLDVLQSSDTLDLGLLEASSSTPVQAVPGNPQDIDMEDPDSILLFLKKDEGSIYKCLWSCGGDRECGYRGNITQVKCHITHVHFELK